MPTFRRFPFSRRGGAGRLLADVRGAVMVEYAVVVGAIALAGSAAVILVGAAVMHNFDFVRGLLLCPLP
jgi:Flp pilus assembly pilin Flp